MVINLYVYNTDGAIEILQGYNSGDSYEIVSAPANLITGVWYHVAATYDDSDMSFRVRVWDDTNSQLLHDDFTGNFTNQINIGSASFVIGNRSDVPATSAFDDLIDEVVVFDKVLSVSEIDEIRSNTFGPRINRAAGTMQVDNIYCSRTEYAATNDADIRHTSDVTTIDGGKIYTGSIIVDIVLRQQTWEPLKQSLAL
jgi:hypothetical protein